MWGGRPKVDKSADEASVPNKRCPLVAVPRGVSMPDSGPPSDPNGDRANADGTALGWLGSVEGDDCPVIKTLSLALSEGLCREDAGDSDGNDEGDRWWESRNRDRGRGTKACWSIRSMSVGFGEWLEWAWNGV